MKNEHLLHKSLSWVCDFRSPHNSSFYLCTVSNLSSVKSSMRYQARENATYNAVKTLNA